MDLSKISIGRNPPHEFNVVVEIPAGGVPVKYEMDKESGAMFVDRFLHTAMYYPANYGFIPHTLSLDGDPLDVVVMGKVPVVPGVIIPCRAIGMLHMEDESGIDEKVVAVPVDRLHPYFSQVTSYNQLPEVERRQLEHFFAHYKDLEPGKWARLSHWVDAAEAETVIMESIARAAEVAKTGAKPTK